MISPTLLILAAGIGSRYGGLKQIDSVGPNGETIIDYSVHDAIRAGFGKLVFVTRKDILKPLRESIGARFEKHIAVDYVLQDLDNLPPGFSVPRGRTKPWGTAHAILTAAEAIREPFAAINADDFYGAESYRVMAKYLQASTADYAMVGFLLRNTLSEFGPVSRGVCEVSEDDFLSSIVEYTDVERDGHHITNRDAAACATPLTGDEIASMNLWGFTPRIFEQLREDFQRFLEQKITDLRAESYITSSVNELVVSGRARVKVLRTGDSWFGVTYREDRSRVIEGIARLVREGYYPDRLWL